VTLTGENRLRRETGPWSDPVEDGLLTEVDDGVEWCRRSELAETIYRERCEGSEAGRPGALCTEVMEICGPGVERWNGWVDQSQQRGQELVLAYAKRRESAYNLVLNVCGS
jgi:hypothetical protein